MDYFFRNLFISYSYNVLYYYSYIEIYLGKLVTPLLSYFIKKRKIYNLEFINNSIVIFEIDIDSNNVDKNTYEMFKNLEYDFCIYSDNKHPNKNGSINKVIYYNVQKMFSEGVDYELSDADIMYSLILFDRLDYNKNKGIYQICKEQEIEVKLKTNKYNFVIKNNILKPVFFKYLLFNYYDIMYVSSIRTKLMTLDGTKIDYKEDKSQITFL